MTDGRGRLVGPGLIDTHHHMCQSLTRAVAVFDLGTTGPAGGAMHDPVGALLLRASPQAAYTVVGWSCARGGLPPSRWSQSWSGTTRWSGSW